MSSSDVTQKRRMDTIIKSCKVSHQETCGQSVNTASIINIQEPPIVVTPVSYTHLTLPTIYSV